MNIVTRAQMLLNMSWHIPADFHSKQSESVSWSTAQLGAIPNKPTP